MLDINHENFYKKLPALNFVQEVNENCQPLFRSIKANYFDYCRVYNNNLVMGLTSDGEYITNFLKNRYPIGGTIKQSGKHLWDSYYYSPAIHDAKVNFNHDHGISIFYKKSNYIEFFNIAAARANREIISIYLNHFDYIEQFLAMFMDKSSKIISIADKQLIMLPKEMCSSLKEDLILKQDCMIFMNQLALSKREKQCLANYLQGNTAKETGRILHISQRTVEEHIKNIKKKLNCRYKHDLLKFFHHEFQFKKV